MLGRVREDDDDEEDTSTNGSENGYQYVANQARTIEQLTRENALLRQAASQLDSTRLRDRAASSVSTNTVYPIAGPSHNPHRIPVSVPEEVDLAVEDLDELGSIPPGYGGLRSQTRRRFSEHSVNLDKQLQAFATLENRPLESLKKAHWQTSLGFGSIAEIPQSRRHSFADIPPRHGSISSIGDNQANLTGVHARSGLVDREEGFGSLAEGAIPNSPTENALYARDHLSGDGVPSGVPQPLQHVYNLPAYNRHQAGTSQPQQNQLLYIVTFKCHRADVFYIQEDTGLQVKLGDLVIVEADRGTDLGTIQHVNVTWQKAKELKEQYQEEHYKLLMLFSRQSQSGASNVVTPGIGNRSAIGGMGPSGGPAQGAHETQSTEIKPKLIKRLAQNHEILTLREKEGNEAKAKRVCQQKVVDHRLNMEILDAEFQMWVTFKKKTSSTSSISSTNCAFDRDWKKLTFYYFADSYINFNALVTDLFKIYKTRIWMSAINPASFVTPGAGLPPSGPSGNTLAFGQETPLDRRHLQDTRGYNLTQFPAGTAAIRDPMDTQLLRTNYVEPYQAFGHAIRQSPDAGIGSFGHPAPLQQDPFASYPSTGYGAADASFADYTNIPSSATGPGQRSHQGHGDWVNRFQGLSLGSWKKKNNKKERERVNIETYHHYIGYMTLSSARYW
jgi:cell fate regulator YaaT (PSP1 superfamily)